MQHEALSLDFDDGKLEAALLERLAHRELADVPLGRRLHGQSSKYSKGKQGISDNMILLGIDKCHVK